MGYLVIQMSNTEDIVEALTPVNDWVWYVAFVFLVGLGLFFTYKIKFLQILKLKETSSLALSGSSEGKRTHKITSFEAFCIGLGARIGVGNIAGVASAIVLGGPGAVFWMWIFAIIGSGSSFMESTLAQIYKEKKSDGNFHGGPAYYATKGLKNRKLGVLLAFLTVITFGIGFVGVQASNASSALVGAYSFDHAEVIYGAIIAVAAAAIIFGGLKKIGKFSSKIVPIMALIWIIFAIVAICFNIGNLGNAISMIFVDAFSAPSLIGGALGTVIMSGLRRGVFSNEAGLGSVANIASTADTKHPVKQGMIQSFGVLVDTLIVCTITALVILSYGSYESIMALGLTKSQLVQAVVASTPFGEAAKYIIAGFMMVFAFTSLIGYYTMSESNIRFIKDDKKVVFAIRVLIIAVAFISCVLGADLMEIVCDTFMAAMGAVNMIAVALLSKKVYEAYKDYCDQKKNGIEEPEFHRDVLSNNEGVTEWE